MRVLLRLLPLVLLVSACGVQKKADVKAEEKPHIVILYKQMSDGEDVPEYNIELYSNRQMHLTAVKNLDKQGRYLRILTESEYKQVIKAFVDADFFSFKDEYKGNDSSLMKTLYFNSNGKEKTVKDFGEAPEKLTELELLLQSFLDRVGWDKMSW